MRLNRYLALCGIASRRRCEEYITAGRVCVNDKTVYGLATIVAETDTVKVDGNEVIPSTEYIYIILHKPKGVVTTCDDERGRKTVIDMIPKTVLQARRVFPVGRLDYDTSGLLILTNDGEFTKRVTHPSSRIPKTYLAKLDKPVTSSDLLKLEKGVEIDGEKTHPAKATGKQNLVELTITQGRNRQVRKMFEALGYKVLDLKRTSIGRLRLGSLRRGEYKVISKPTL